MTEAEIIRRESPEMEALFDGLASVAEQMSEIAATHRPSMRLFSASHADDSMIT